MADRQAVRARRRVIATIVVLEVLLLLFQWKLPKNQSAVDRYDFVPLDMLIVVAVVLLAAKSLSGPQGSDNYNIDLSSAWGLAHTWAIPAALVFGCMGLGLGTVMAGWLIGLIMFGVVAGTVLFAYVMFLPLVFFMSPTGKRFGVAMERGFAAIGRSAPVRKLVGYFAAEDVAGN